MHRRKKEKLLRCKSMIFMMSIFALSSLGVCYGAWDEELNIDIAIKTGFMNTQFEDCYYEKENENGSLTITNYDKKIYIEGRCNSGFKGYITVVVKNNGTVPIYSEKTGEILPSQTAAYTLYIEPVYNGSQLLNTLIEYEGFDNDSIMEELYPKEVYVIDEEIEFVQWTNP